MTAVTADLVHEVEVAGGRLIPLGDGRLRVTAPQPLSGELVDRLRRYKPAILAHLKHPNERSRTGPARRPGWDAETSALIEWFKGTEPPTKPFELSKGVTVAAPKRFWEALRRDIGLGPHGPRARYGSLQQDLRRLAELLK